MSLRCLCSNLREKIEKSSKQAIDESINKSLFIYPFILSFVNSRALSSRSFSLLLLSRIIRRHTECTLLGEKYIILPWGNVYRWCIYCRGNAVHQYALRFIGWDSRKRKFLVRPFHGLCRKRKSSARDEWHWIRYSSEYVHIGWQNIKRKHLLGTTSDKKNWKICLRVEWRGRTIEGMKVMSEQGSGRTSSVECFYGNPEK